MTKTLLVFLLAAAVVLCSDGRTSYKFHWCKSLYNPSLPPLDVVSGFSTLIFQSHSNLFSTYETANPPIWFMFQCMASLSNPVCGECVALGARKLQTLCDRASGGDIRLEGCHVRYGTDDFVGKLNTTVAWSQCGDSFDGENADEKAKFFNSMDLQKGEYAFVNDDNIYGYEECSADLTTQDCLSCLSTAVTILKGRCGWTAFGAVYLDKCYSTFKVNAESGSGDGQAGVDGTRSSGGGQSDRENTGVGDSLKQTLAIFISTVVGSVLLGIISFVLVRECRRSRCCAGESSMDRHVDVDADVDVPSGASSGASVNLDI